MNIFQTAQDQNAVGQSTLNDLVGEGKKFKTPDDLAKAKLESDRFIEKLQNEQRELREELNKRLTIEDALRKAQEAGVQVEPRQPSEPAPVPQRQNEQLNISSEVEKVITKREQESKFRNNLETVFSRMTDLYGNADKAAEVISSRSRELGMSVNALQQMASENPKAFFQLLGVQDKPQGAPQTSSWNNVKNTTAMKNAAGSTTTVPGTYKYYEEIRKSDPAAYFSPRVQLQMDKDAREKGEKFYS
jgi:vacuolar-type H+-ATPase subunit I/STV1